MKKLFLDTNIVVDLLERRIAFLARRAGQTLNAYIKEALEEKAEAAVAM